MVVHDKPSRTRFVTTTLSLCKESFVKNLQQSFGTSCAVVMHNESVDHTSSRFPFKLIRRGVQKDSPEVGLRPRFVHVVRVGRSAGKRDSQTGAFEGRFNDNPASFFMHHNFNELDAVVVDIFAFDNEISNIMSEFSQVFNLLVSQSVISQYKNVISETPILDNAMVHHRPGKDGKPFGSP